MVPADGTVSEVIPTAGRMLDDGFVNSTVTITKNDLLYFPHTFNVMKFLILIQ